MKTLLIYQEFSHYVIKTFDTGVLSVIIKLNDYYYDSTKKSWHIYDSRLLRHLSHANIKYKIKQQAILTISYVDDHYEIMPYSINKTVTNILKKCSDKRGSKYIFNEDNLIDMIHKLSCANVQFTLNKN